MFGAMELVLIIPLIILMAVIAVVIFIQLKLSRSENKLLGLIMPIISFLLSFMMILGINTLIVFGESNINYLSTFFAFLVANIPTMILGGIYYSERNKIKVSKAIEKTKIEDL